MKFGLTVAFLMALVLPACVSEGPEPRTSQNASSEEDVGPVERVEARLEQRIALMPGLGDEALLREGQMLIRYRELSLGPIGRALETADARTRVTLLWCLGYIGGQQARTLVLPWLADADESVAYEAAASLAEMGDWSGVPRLIMTLESTDRRLRYKAIQALEPLAGEDFGYDFAVAAPLRSPSVSRWKQWWAQRRGKSLRRDVRPAAQR